MIVYSLTHITHSLKFIHKPIIILVPRLPSYGPWFLPQPNPSSCTDTHPHTDHCSSTFFHIPQTFKGINFSKTNLIKQSLQNWNSITQSPCQLGLEDNRQVSLITLRITIGNVQRGYIIFIITRMVYWFLFLRLCVNVCIHKMWRNC